MEQEARDSKCRGSECLDHEEHGPILVPKSNSALLIVGISKGSRCSHTEGVDQAIGNECDNLCLGLGWSLDEQI